MPNLPFAPVQSSALTWRGISPTSARGLYLLIIVAAAAAGVYATDPGTGRAAAGLDADLTRLLRLMTLIKASMAAVAIGIVLWRLDWPASPSRFGIYAFAGATMVIGPGLIWHMAHVGLGALLLHAGLATTMVLIWRDPAVWTGIDAVRERRGARRRTGPSPG